MKSSSTARCCLRDARCCLKDDEEPEYSDLTYLAMVWCAGVAIGLIFYGASEPLAHAVDGTNKYNNNGYFNENEQEWPAHHALPLGHPGLDCLRDHCADHGLPVLPEGAAFVLPHHSQGYLGLDGRPAGCPDHRHRRSRPSHVPRSGGCPPDCRRPAAA